MNARVSRKAAGFTLIEMSIVILVSGLIMAGGFQAYRIYLKNQFSTDAYDKQQTIAGSISRFRSNPVNAQRYPCPSNPNMPLTDPNAGREIAIASCAQLRSPLTPAGTCIEGVCKALGRDTTADADAIGDAILIGGIPFADIKEGAEAGSTRLNIDLSAKDVLDPWGYQMSYIVTANMTSSDTILNQPTYGVIPITTPAPGLIDLVQPASSGVMAIISHGDNHLGAHSREGTVPFPCTGGTADVMNCDLSGRVVVGVRTLTQDSTYFDDVVYHESASVGALWQAGTGGVFNTNPGNVGVGLENPQNKLEVNGNVSALRFTQNQICDTAGHCWSPKAFASATGMQCPASGTPGMINVVKGIVGDSSAPHGLNLVCELAPMAVIGTNQSCAPLANPSNPADIRPTYAVGFNTLGQIICELAPGTSF
jgi:prepilin-type N-terminal cleavage/methylation domain-containing protein